jgi:hypothetical protein
MNAIIGFRWDLYKESYGRFEFGSELEYLNRTSFSGIGGAPSTDNFIYFNSLSYYF